MNNIEPGLGELLRHLLELTDGKADHWYKGQGIFYRPRYTPIMRMLEGGPASVSALQTRLSVTQGAVSQTIKLMLEDGLIEKRQGQDARQSILELSADGRALLGELKPHWQAVFRAIAGLEQEIKSPLIAGLGRAVAALEQRSFAARIEEAASGPSVAAEKTNYFDKGGADYAKYRPEYPASLAESLADLVPNRKLALDVGCGTGQLTALLAPHFDQVIGTDPSESQLATAKPAHNITYRAQPAEEIGLPDQSVDLVVAAQAAHWFNLDRFYPEIRRVAAPDAVIALVSYGVPTFTDAINSIFQRYYWQELHEFWPPARAHVEAGYTDLYFPFSEITLPAHHCQRSVTLQGFVSYMRTWSAYRKACDAGQQDRFQQFFDKLESLWPDDGTKGVVWPIAVRAARIHQ